MQILLFITALYVVLQDNTRTLRHRLVICSACSG